MHAPLYLLINSIGGSPGSSCSDWILYVTILINNIMASSRDCSKSFCSNYMVVKADEATVFELIRLLFSPYLEKRQFLEFPYNHINTDQKKHPFQPRWIIFISVLLQKLLKLVAKPLAAIGSAIEHWLNLVSSNGNFFNLVFNFLTGPNSTSILINLFIHIFLLLWHFYILHL